MLSASASCRAPTCACMPRLTTALADRGLAGEVLLLVGGTIPEDDVAPLQAMGVHGVFPVGSFTTEMIDFIRANRPEAPPARYE